LGEVGPKWLILSAKLGGTLSSSLIRCNGGRFFSFVGPLFFSHWAKIGPGGPGVMGAHFPFPGKKGAQSSKRVPPKGWPHWGTRRGAQFLKKGPPKIWLGGGNPSNFPPPFGGGETPLFFSPPQNFGEPFV